MIPSRRADSLEEFVVFVVDMADFERNRGTKEDQERLLRDGLRAQHTFFGAFDDSGNYAIATAHGAARLRRDVLATLRTQYRVDRAVVISRSELTEALYALEKAARARYGPAFSPKSYGVGRTPDVWRVGAVFLSPQIPPAETARLQAIDIPTVIVLTVTPGVVGVAKLDTGRRIPWGDPAGRLARLLDRDVPGIVATGRSARTVRGVLRRFPEGLASDKLTTIRAGRLPRPESEPRAGGPSAGIAAPGQGYGDRGGAMFAESRAGEFESTETMLRDHSGLRRSGPEMVDVFVQVARLVWKESSGTIEPRKAGDRETYIPFSPVGTERNLTDSMFASGRVRFAFKIPEELLPAVDPERRTKILLQQGRWKPYNRQFRLDSPLDVSFVSDLILACVLERPRSTEPQTRSRPGATSGGALNVGLELGVWWEESERAFRAGFWRLCVILCAGIIEGRLRDILESPSSVNRRERAPMDAIDLLKAATERGILRPEIVAECHAVRKLRNQAVHPPRSDERPANFTRDVARIARETVGRCHRLLGANG